MRINVHDFEREAEERLPRPVFDYYQGGARDEITLRGNRSAFDAIRIDYRVLRGVGRRETHATLLGADVGVPIGVAPMALQRMAHADGEAATARATAAAGALMVVSTMSTLSLEEVAAASSGPTWFQLYVYRDRSVTESLVRRAEAAGYQALVLTVDTPWVGVRERDVRNAFGMPPGMQFANFVSVGLEDMGHGGRGSHLARYSDAQFDPDLTWDDVTWLQSITSLPVVVKGVVHPDDARLAVEAGARGLVVSNHGARQLDTSPPAIEALPRVVEAVEGRAEVYVDGGIRRGTDIVKALALGAHAVWVGRPVLWGLAVDGEAGVHEVLSLLRSELEDAMGLSGFRTLEEIRTLGPASVRFGPAY
ncbi:MAG: alpha-hydroxy acid oxidase [Gemmatimonadota bacterium]